MYNAAGGRDVLVVVPDLPLTHPEAVARRPGQLTEGDKLKLQSQGLPPDCHDELDIITARWKMDKRIQIVRFKKRQSLSREEVLESIAYLFNTTLKDGGRMFLHRYDALTRCLVLGGCTKFLMVKGCLQGRARAIYTACCTYTVAYCTRYT